MLNINPVNIFNKNFRLNAYKPVSYQTNSFAKSGLLAPLAKDTISFSGSVTLNRSLLEAFDNVDICEEINENAELAESRLKKVLKNSLNKYVASETNPEGPIELITTRIKTPDSIREKAASELEDALLKDIDKVFNPKDAEAIKSACGDLVGARVILRKTDISDTSKIIDAIIEDVKEGRLNITKIENYELSDAEEKLQYFSEKDLQRLALEVSKKRAEKNLPPLSVLHTNKRSGYMALHLDVDLSDPEYKAKNNNYKGEIQIVGLDVSQLKDVEDFCYKLKSKKSIRSNHPAYVPFSEYFKNNMGRNEEYPDISSDFEKYTRTAYIIQRKKDCSTILANKRKKTIPQLPTIEECGLAGKIPPELDYNKLTRLKSYCDRIYELIQNNDD